MYKLRNDLQDITAIVCNLESLASSLETNEDHIAMSSLLLGVYNKLDSLADRARELSIAYTNKGLKIESEEEVDGN